MQSELQIELNRRDRKRYLEELSELESNLASYHSRIFWTTLNLLIVEPAVTAGITYYFINQIENAWKQGFSIANLGSNIKWSAACIAFAFASTSLTLLYYLWRVASLQSQIARIRVKINRLER